MFSVLASGGSGVVTLTRRQRYAVPICRVTLSNMYWTRNDLLSPPSMICIHCMDQESPRDTTASGTISSQPKSPILPTPPNTTRAPTRPREGAFNQQGSDWHQGRA